MERPNWTEIQTINNIWINHWDISSEANLSNFNYPDFFIRSSHPICVIVNSECNETNSVLKEISKRTMFHFERYWLFFGRHDDDVFNILSGQNINVDAEVAIAVRNSEK